MHMRAFLRPVAETACNISHVSQGITVRRTLWNRACMHKDERPSSSALCASMKIARKASTPLKGYALDLALGWPRV